MPSTEIKPKTISTTPGNSRSEISAKKYNNEGFRPPPYLRGSTKNNAVEESLGYMGEYSYSHNVLPPSGLETSTRVAKLADPKTIGKLANPHLFIRDGSSINRNGN